MRRWPYVLLASIIAIASTATVLAAGRTAGSTPASLSWTTKSPIPYWVTYMGAAGASDGRLYAVVLYPTFDYGDGLIHAAEYDPSTDAWTVRPGGISGPDGGYTAVEVVAATNGEIYVLIGNASLGPVFLEYTPATDTWSSHPSPPGSVTPGGFAAAANGRLYLLGESLASGSSASIFQMYDPIAGTWATRTPRLPDTRPPTSSERPAGRSTRLGWVRSWLTILPRTRGRHLATRRF